MNSTSKSEELSLLKELLQKKENEKSNILKKIDKTNSIDTNNYFSGDEFSDNDDNELYCKIGQKKTICIYGLRNKLPISMRPDQWEKLYEFMMSGKLHQFIKDNQKNLQ